MMQSLISISRRTPRRRLLVATLAAALAAVGATTAFYSVAMAAGLVDTGVVLPSPVGMGPMSVASVSVTALLATLAAGVLLAVLTAATRRPIRTFRIVATALALASLSMPITIPGPGAGMRLTMLAMHLIVWVVSVGVLANLAGGAPRRA